MAKSRKKTYKFKTEIQQLLDILIHSLYSEKEIFLRELVSNSSDALNRFKVESLKSQEVFDPEAELGIWITADKEANTLTIRDTGIGMTAEELNQYLGTIAKSGAKSFVEKLQELNKGNSSSTNSMIGQFGVGFYSVFMVADEVTVNTRSYLVDAEAVSWHSKGQGSYQITEIDKDTRGTEIIIKLKEDATEFAQNYRIRQIIKRHSNFVNFPIYILEETERDGKKVTEWQQVNEQTAIWRERPQDIDDEKYNEFYKQISFDFSDPLKVIHFNADMPIQLYALMYIPSKKDNKFMGNADDYGLQLYARKILIKEKFKELLPPYLRFIEGVVDSEDIPLNVSRETVQDNPIIAKINKVLVGRVANELKKMAKNEKEKYEIFFKEFGVFLKEAIATDMTQVDKFVDLLRFVSNKNADYISLKDYVENMKEDQKEIYYILGDDLATLSRSPHLEYFNKNGLEVIYLNDPIDSFMLMNLSEYDGKKLRSIDDMDIELPDDKENKDEKKKASRGFKKIQEFVKASLGEKVEDVRESQVLVDSVARLVSPPGGDNNFYRMQKLMGQSVEVPKKILELNPKSALVKNIGKLIKEDPDSELAKALIEQIYENELLSEGLHPNPADMIPRIQELMALASKK